MNETELRKYTHQLHEMLDELESQDALGKESQRTVELDQQSVGRLSRMDALQQQAMARATASRRAAEHARIKAALDRIEQDEFGWCTDCGDAIDSARLDLNPAVALCLSCAKG